MTNVPIPEESKGIKQWQEYGNLAKEAILGLNGDKPRKLTIHHNTVYMLIPIETV